MNDQPQRDDVDAILSDAAVDGDLALLAAVMHDLRAEYVTDEPLARSASLLAFTEPLAVPVTATVTPVTSRIRRRGLQAAGIGVVGKVLLGTTLAAASVGGLRATDVIELPGLPDTAADQAVEVRPATVEPAAAAPAPDPTVADDDSDTEGEVPVTNDDGVDVSGAGDAPGAVVSLEAHMNQDKATQFVDANVAWHECADDLPQAERVAACGERPHPADFGLTDPPGELARDEAAAASGRPTDAGSPAMTAPGRTRDGGGPGQPSQGPEQSERETGRP